MRFHPNSSSDFDDFTAQRTAKNLLNFVDERSSPDVPQAPAAAPKAAPKAVPEEPVVKVETEAEPWLDPRADCCRVRPM